MRKVVGEDAPFVREDLGRTNPANAPGQTLWQVRGVKKVYVEDLQFASEQFLAGIVGHLQLTRATNGSGTAAS